MANYLYNGMELPDINTVWTDEMKAEKPYAFLIYFPNHGVWYLYSCQNAAKYDPEYLDYGEIKEALVSPGTSNFWSIRKAETVWERNATDKSLNRVIIGSTNPESYVVWSSYDILHIDDNSVYLAASDPIPVNSAPTLDPTALLMGWQVVRRIAWQRSKGATE